MDVNGNDGLSDANPADSSLLSDLGNVGGETSETNPLIGESGVGQAGATESAYKFAGREYKDQAAAEKAWKQLYGKHSESQSILKTVREALKDPELLEALSEDPKWADIFAKLGIEDATRQVEREGQGRESQPMSAEMQEWKIERDIDRLEREEFRFERELGRSLNDQERRSILTILKRASSLSFKEAWQLANHERLLGEARKGGQPPAPPAGGRPKPPPVSAPGTQVNTKKSISKMSDGEWKENLRNDPDMKEIFSR